MSTQLVSAPSWQQQLIDLFRESTITQGILAIGLTGLMGYCVVSRFPPPDYLILSLGTVYGFYFRAKADYKAAKAVAAATATAEAAANQAANTAMQ